MDKEDRILDRLLDTYKVENANDALLDRIVAQAQATKRPPLRVPVNDNWFRQAGILTACALFGFWYGSATPTVVPQQSDTISVTESGSVSLDALVLGPDNFNEVLL